MKEGIWKNQRLRTDEGRSDSHDRIRVESRPPFLNRNARSKSQVTAAFSSRNRSLHP